jgi:hypothetical protein
MSRPGMFLTGRSLTLLLRMLRCRLNYFVQDEIHTMAHSHNNPKPIPVLTSSETLSTSPKNEFKSKQGAESKQESYISHDLEAEGEAMTAAHFTNGLPQIILDSLGGDLNSTWSGDKKTTKFTVEQHTQFKLFGRHYKDLLHHPEATSLANLILCGKEEDVVKSLALVKNNPSLLHYHILATDPLGRKVQGTPLQIAAMAGDVDLKKEILDEKDRGLVERLALAGGLSKEQVAEQLEVITGSEAKQKNEKRNLRILTAIKVFGRAIHNINDDKFDVFQASCQPLITQLEQDLQADEKEIITSGYIFDTQILNTAAKWFQDNIKQFGHWSTVQSDVFWINGFGKLQSKLSSRDAQVVRAGVGFFVYDGILPARILNNPDGTSYFFNSDSRLGRDVCLDYHSDAWRQHPINNSTMPVVWKDYAEKKQATILNLSKAKIQRGSAKRKFEGNDSSQGRRVP